MTEPSVRCHPATLPSGETVRVRLSIYRIAAGSRHVRLTVIADWKTGDGPLRCTCECGAVLEIRAQSWGVKRSCGCLRPTSETWRGMVERCTNPNHHSWDQYGGRGIAVCERWRSFLNFYADMGQRPAGTTIDRIDVNGDYEPGNCRWATAAQQAANKRPYGGPYSRTGMCKRGLHELTPENRQPVGQHTTCKACFMEYQREYKRAARAAAKLQARDAAKADMG